MTDKTPEGYEYVDHPSHYNVGGIEAIDVIAAWNLGFWLGSVVKYVARLGRKPGAKELAVNFYAMYGN